jgi:hypothetical protein
VKRIFDAPEVLAAMLHLFMMQTKEGPSITFSVRRAAPNLRNRAAPITADRRVGDGRQGVAKAAEEGSANLATGASIASTALGASHTMNTVPTTTLEIAYEEHGPGALRAVVVARAGMAPLDAVRQAQGTLAAALRRGAAFG